MGIRAVYDSATTTITDTIDTAGLLASAGKRLAEVADNKAKRFSEMVELKDKAEYISTKKQLENQLAALGVSLNDDDTK